MTVPPELLPTPPAFSASMQLSPSGMKIAGVGVLVSTLILCVFTGVLSWDQALTVLDQLHP